MESHVISPYTGDGTAALTTAEAIEYHELFRMGAKKEVLLLGDPEKVGTHHVKGQKRKLCRSVAGLCELCEKAPFDKDVSQRQEEVVFPGYVRGDRESEFVQRVVVVPNTGEEAAAKKLHKLLGGQYRGRLVKIVRGTSNRLEITPGGSLPADLPATLPPAFPCVNFVLARFGLRPDPRYPVLRLPPIRCEVYTPTTGFAPKELDVSAPSAEERAKVRQLLDEYKRRTGTEATPSAAASADDTVVEDRPRVKTAAVVEPAEVTMPVPATPPATGPSLDEATNEQLRVEAVRRQLGLKNGTRPRPPAEAGDVVGDLLDAAEHGGTQRVIPPIKRHGDGTWTGPATVPMNGHHSPNGKKGGR